MKKVRCYNCSSVTEAETIGFRQNCESCHEDLHICLNCSFYDENSYNECREPVAERITVKDRSNLCDFFSPNHDSSASSASEKKADLLAQAEALFSKKPSE